MEKTYRTSYIKANGKAKAISKRRGGVIRNESKEIIEPGKGYNEPGGGYIKPKSSRRTGRSGTGGGHTPSGKNTYKHHGTGGGYIEPGGGYIKPETKRVSIPQTPELVKMTLPRKIKQISPLRVLKKI